MRFRVILHGDEFLVEGTSRLVVLGIRDAKEESWGFRAWVDGIGLAQEDDEKHRDSQKEWKRIFALY